MNRFKEKMRGEEKTVRFFSYLQLRVIFVFVGTVFCLLATQLLRFTSAALKRE